MQKLYKMIILLGFILVVIGGIIYVGGQMVSLALGMPELMITLESTITGLIFPIASVSGLLCFVYGYIFKKKKNA